MRRLSRSIRPLRPALLMLGLATGCPHKPLPKPRVRRRPPAPRVDPCRKRPLPKSAVALPVDGCKRYLQSTVPLPVPPDASTVHLELGPLGKDAASRRLLAAVWANLRVDSAAAGQLLPYLKRCGVTPRDDARAITLVQPLGGRPDVERIAIFWGLLMAQRVVTCLRGAMEDDGARIGVLQAGGEPAFSADRAASDLHLDAVALNDGAVLVAAGKTFRAEVRRLLRGRGRSLSGTPHYRRLVRDATPRTLLLALAPRLPRSLPHLELPEDAHHYVRGMTFVLARPPGTGAAQLRLTGELEVGGERRAHRWAGLAPGRMRLLSLMIPAEQRPLLSRLRFSSKRTRIRLRLDLGRKDLPPFGRLVSRWLPW